MSRPTDPAFPAAARALSRRPIPPGAVAAIIAAGLGLFACQGRRFDPGTLTVAVDSGPISLDPRLGSDEASHRFNDLVFNGLFRVGDDALPEPDLAESWSAPDPLTLVVTLKPGVPFHDGGILQADDVVDTYRSILDGRVASFLRPDLAAIAGVEARDPRTVVFRLKTPCAALRTNLNIPILRAGSDAVAARHPIGTGPFRLVRYRKDEDLTLERFERYFEGRPAVRRLNIRIVPSATSRLLELLRGSTDVVVNDLAPDDFDRVARMSGFQVASRPGRNTVYIGFNLRDRLAGDRRLRQAVACSLDRPAIVRHLLHGRATLATGLLPPHHWAYNPDVPGYSYDLSRARRLLDEAGLTDPDGPGPRPRCRLEYKAPSGELAQQLAIIVQEQLALAGIAVDIRTFDWPTFYEDIRAGRFQVMASNWTEINDPDVYRLRFHSGFLPPLGLNRGGYVNPEIDRLIEEGATILDGDRRRADYARIQSILAEDLPYICLWHRDVAAAWRTRVHGFVLDGAGGFRALWRVTLAGDDDGPRAGPVSGEPAAQDLLDGSGGDRSGADQARRIDGDVENGRRAPAGGRPRVEDHRQVFAERGFDFLRGERCWRAGEVGAGRDHRPSQEAGEGRRHRMWRHPHSDGRAASQQAGRKIGGGVQNQRQRPGPERRHQPVRRSADAARAEHDRLVPAHDQRQRHAIGASLGDEDAVHRRRQARIAPQAVECLGRIGHQKSAAHALRGTRQNGRIRESSIDPLQRTCHGSSGHGSGLPTRTITQGTA
jgi:peptide/nickel transport system substrate-binding protein